MRNYPLFGLSKRTGGLVLLILLATLILGACGDSATNTPSAAVTTAAATTRQHGNVGCRYVGRNRQYGREPLSRSCAKRGGPWYATGPGDG